MIEELGQLERLSSVDWDQLRHRPPGIWRDHWLGVSDRTQEDYGLRGDHLWCVRATVIVMYLAQPGEQAEQRARQQESLSRVS